MFSFWKQNLLVLENENYCKTISRKNTYVYSKSIAIIISCTSTDMFCFKYNVQMVWWELTHPSTKSMLNSAYDVSKILKWMIENVLVCTIYSQKVKYFSQMSTSPFLNKTVSTNVDTVVKWTYFSFKKLS